MSEERAIEGVAAERAALFVDDRELHRRINPALSFEKFRAALSAAERDPSFPKVKALWGGRYWPAAKAWFDKDNGVESNGEIQSQAEDGPENFDAAPRKAPRLQARTARSAVLDREPGRAQRDGLPRLVHSAATRRE